MCIKAKQSKKVMVVFSASEREASLCVERAAVVANVAFFYGDEIMRQKYRRSALFCICHNFSGSLFKTNRINIEAEKEHELVLKLYYENV